MFYGKNQMTTGAYRLVLVENAGKPNMVTLDYVDAFILNNKMNNMTSSGYDTAYNMKTQIVNLTSIMSTQSGVTNLHDYYTKFDVDELLNEYAKSVDLQSYAKVKHTHDQYALKSELFSKDYNDLTNKPTIPSEYDDTQVRNL